MALVIRVVLFNIGVEIGQLVALAIFVGIGRLVARRLRRRPSAARAAFGSLVVAGLIAAAVLSFPAGTDDPEPRRSRSRPRRQRPRAAGCAEPDEQAQPGSAAATRPRRSSGPPRRRPRTSPTSSATAT